MQSSARDGRVYADGEFDYVETISQEITQPLSYEFFFLTNGYSYP